MQYALDKEKEALYLYKRLRTKKHEKVKIEEPGLLVDPKNLWMGVSLDGICQCECCGSRTLEIKCPLTCKNMDPKSAFFSTAIGGKTNDSGKKVLKRNHLHYFQVQMGMAISQIDKCDFIVYTEKGIDIVEIPFDADFWSDVFKTVSFL